MKKRESKFSNEDSIPLLFQTGYLTIKDVNPIANLYRLGIPNGEVRSALVDQLMPAYTGIKQNEFPLRLARLQEKVRNGDVAGWIEEVKSLISGIPYHLFGSQKSHLAEEEARKHASEVSVAHFERTYHIITHMIFQMLDINAHSEIAVAGGRVDMVIGTFKYLYVVEFKLDGTTAEALSQIDDKGYLLPWHTDHRHLFKIGIVFSSEDCNISAFDYYPKP
ncbi:MAG: PD-(D/E)XK nuclease domain-containing protein [Bacteroidales bacterium]|nr:PD-(D/E)XK nuclease domain-containing protein [Bacteroidales bacterium]